MWSSSGVVFLKFVQGQQRSTCPWKIPSRQAVLEVVFRKPVAVRAPGRRNARGVVAGVPEIHRAQDYPLQQQEWMPEGFE